MQENSEIDSGNSLLLEDKPEQIGTADSQGCIRLHNGNAILLYNLFEEGLSTVEVAE